MHHPEVRPEESRQGQKDPECVSIRRIRSYRCQEECYILVCAGTGSEWRDPGAKGSLQGQGGGRPPPHPEDNQLVNQTAGEARGEVTEGQENRA
jgi:hypothetical protein